MFESLRKSIQNRIDSLQYTCLAARAAKPAIERQELEAGGYYSQCGQDKWVAEQLFPGKTNGTFVDIGANDGMTFSNTYRLEKIGWQGVAVEPIPGVYERLAANRNCVVVNGCIAPHSGRRQFRLISGYSQMLSGLAGEYEERHLQRIDREIDVHGGQYEDVEVECYNFNELLDNKQISHIDYLSIDVEGLEYKILNSIDFDRIRISVIGVENNYRDSRIPKLLRHNGFEFHSIVGDEFYRSRRAA